MNNYKLRIQSLINAISGDADRGNTLESANVYSIGTWSLTHQQWLETFCQSSNLQLVAVNNCSQMLELTKDLVHLPYGLGVALCHTDNDMADALRLLKFLNTSHPDRVIQIIFMGTNADLESALYLSERSTGYKQIDKVDEGNFRYLLEQTLEKSRKQRAQIIEKLINVAKLSSLTTKELATMIHVINGFSNKEIAEKMGNSNRTIEIHRANLFEKMDVKNGIELSMTLHHAFKS